MKYLVLFIINTAIVLQSGMIFYSVRHIKVMKDVEYKTINDTIKVVFAITIVMYLLNLYKILRIIDIL